MSTIRRPGWAALAVCVLASAPWLILLLAGISPLTVASEAVGYRLFYLLRMQSSEPSTILLTQGQTLGIYHHLLLFLIRPGLSNRPLLLRLWLDGFAFATNFLWSALLYFSLRAAGASRLGFCLAVSLLLFSIYSCRSGIFYALDPDYYGFELVATIFLVALAVRWNDLRPSDDWSAILKLAVLTGLMAGQKFTLAASSLLLLLPLLCTRIGPWRRIASQIIGFCIISGTTFLVVLFLYYRGNLASIPAHFRLLATFIRQAGAEDKFWPSLFTPGARNADPGADYGYARFVLIIWLLSLSIAGYMLCRLWSRRLAAVVVANLILGAFHISGLLTRPAGSTLWEASICLLAGSSCILIALTPGRTLKTVAVCAAMGVWAIAVSGGPKRFHQMLPIARLEGVSNSIWQAHWAFVNSPPPHVFLIPDNDYTAGTVEETLMKGATDYPTWQITSGRWIQQRFDGEAEIVHTLAGIASNATVLVVEMPSHQFPALAKGRIVTEWPASIYPWWSRSIVLYSKH